MCGICGVADSTGRMVAQAELERMNARIRHRGPDSDGFHRADGVGLAVRRLAIIGIEGGDQPIANEDETLWIVYNGESYNYRELRQRLEQQGHRFRTDTDTECVLHLYEEHGDDCVQQLRGQVAFALWDSQRERLLLARDRLGQKPVYYSVVDGRLYFGSELRALLAALPRQPEIELGAIDQYLSLQYVPEPITAYQGVFKLPAGHRLVWEDGRATIESYWDLDFEPKHAASKNELVEELQTLLSDAVEMRLMSEVPLGAHLSGGIDSSVIVALMAEASARPVKTFSVGFEETQFSELPYARAVAERYATEHHEFTLSFGDIPVTLEELLPHFGEPFADPSALPLWHLARLTREHVTVALNGDGGDEAFAGYPRYWLDPVADRYLRLPGFITQGLVPRFVGLLPDRADKPVGGSLANGLKRLPQLAQIDRRASLLRWGSYFSPAHKAALWQPQWGQGLNLRKAEEDMAAVYAHAPAKTRLDRTLYTDIKTYLPGDLLVKADRMTMAHSLEGRSPFLDHVLAEWAARLPVDYKVRGRQGKYLLRKAFAHLLPEDLGQRGKQGFGIPVGAWLRGPLAAWTRELLLAPDGVLAAWFRREAIIRLIAEHDSGRQDHGKRLWALICLALWARAQESL